MNAAVLVIAGQMLSAVLLDWLYQDMTPGLVKIVGVLFVLYHFSNGEFVRISDDIVRKKDVIAINQQVYDRSSFDVSIIPRCVPEWHYYMTLGRRLHALQSNPLYIGLMSSGYSSESNNDLSSAKRMRSILNALESQKIDMIIQQAVLEAKKNNIVGNSLTKYLMRTIDRETDGISAKANMAVLVNTAEVAGKLAVAHAFYKNRGWS